MIKVIYKRLGYWQIEELPDEMLSYAIALAQLKLINGAEYAHITKE